MTHRERLDATITRSIHQRWAHHPKRARYEERRYLGRVEQYRDSLPPGHDLSTPAERHLRYMARCGRGWGARYARAKLAACGAAHER